MGRLIYALSQGSCNVTIHSGRVMKPVSAWECGRYEPVGIELTVLTIEDESHTYLESCCSP